MVLVKVIMLFFISTIYSNITSILLLDLFSNLSGCQEKDPIPNSIPKNVNGYRFPPLVDNKRPMLPISKSMTDLEHCRKINWRLNSKSNTTNSVEGHCKRIQRYLWFKFLLNPPPILSPFLSKWLTSSPLSWRSHKADPSER